jgi:hypothetical protein
MHVTVGPASSWRWTLIAAAISIVVIVAAETLVHRISSREPSITYAAPESLPFNGGGRNVGIYQVEITNEGDAVAEGLTGSVRVPAATIDNQRVSGPGALLIDAKADGDTVRLSAPSLNPTETIHLSILASSAATLPSEPEVSVRAIGTSGIRRVPGGRRANTISFRPTLLIATGTAAVMMLLQLVFRRRREGYNAATQQGWSKAADVFWLGHDLHWTASAARSWGNRERILHGLRQCRHHASEIGLASTPPCQDLDSLDLAVGKMTDADLTAQSRPDIAAKVNGSLDGFGRLAQAQQPGFKAGPG